MSTGLEGLQDTVSPATRTSLERKRERERARAQHDRHARSARRFLRSHYEITVCDRIASNCSVWDPPKFDFEVEVVSPFKGSNRPNLTVGSYDEFALGIGLYLYLSYCVSHTFHFSAQ